MIKNNKLLIVGKSVKKKVLSYKLKLYYRYTVTVAQSLSVIKKEINSRLPKLSFSVQ